jgi:hypothetical protein
MDMVRRAYIQARKEIAQEDTMAIHSAMVMNMVRWIKLRVYSKRDWPREFGEYPKHLEDSVTE